MVVYLKSGRAAESKALSIFRTLTQLEITKCRNKLMDFDTQSKMHKVRNLSDKPVYSVCRKGTYP